MATTQALVPNPGHPRAFGYLKPSKTTKRAKQGETAVSTFLNTAISLVFVENPETQRKTAVSKNRDCGLRRADPKTLIFNRRKQFPIHPNVPKQVLYPKYTLLDIQHALNTP